jgi:hypothetical protein
MEQKDLSPLRLSGTAHLLPQDNSFLPLYYMQDPEEDYHKCGVDTQNNSESRQEFHLVTSFIVSTCPI